MGMNLYFSRDIAVLPFEMFSEQHFIALFSTAAAVALLALWFKTQGHGKAVGRFRYFLAFVIGINEISYILWSILSGAWSPDNSLPLQLCEATAFLAVFMLLKESFFSFEIVYFWGLGGGLQALLTPDLYYPFPHFMFFNFFTGHGAVLAAILYMLCVLHYKPLLSSIPKVFAVTNLYAAFVGIINLVTGGNYMFLCRKPENSSVLDFLGPWPWYILSLEALALGLFFLCYLPFAAGKEQHPKDAAL